MEHVGVWVQFGWFVCYDPSFNAASTAELSSHGNFIILAAQRARLRFEM